MNFIPSIWGFKFKIFRQMLSRLKDNFIIFEAWSGDTLLGISTFLTGLRIHIILYESRSNFSFWCIRLLSEANIFWQQNLFQIKNLNVYFFFIFNVLKRTRSGIPDRDPCFFKSGSGSATLGPFLCSSPNFYWPPLSQELKIHSLPGKILPTLSQFIVAIKT